VVDPGDGTREVEDRYGLDAENNPNHLGRLLGFFVPQRVVRRGIDVTVDTDRDRYAANDTVRFTIEFHNRLPVPVTVRTPTPRLWGWTVDDCLEASDEPRRQLGEVGGGQLSFRSRERKRVTRRWDGRIKRVGDPTRWEPASGEVVLSAFLAVNGRRPSDETTIRLE
jgi:hypothetical protein